MALTHPIEKWWQLHQRGDFDEEAFAARSIAAIANADDDVVTNFTLLYSECQAAIVKHCPSLEQCWTDLIDRIDTETIAGDEIEQPNEMEAAPLCFDAERFRSQLSARVAACKLIVTLSE